MRKGRFDEALTDLNRVLSMEPTSAQGHYLRSKIFWAKGDDLKRRQDLTEALQASPDSLAVRIEAADAQMRANRPKEAMQMLNEAPPHQKRTLAFAIAYNWALIGLGNATEARKTVDRALAVSKDPQLLLQDAVLKIATRDFKGARAVLDQTLQTNPEDLRALSLLGESYAAERQRPAATQRIRQIAQERPQSLRLQIFWAQWLLEENQKAEARKVLAAVVAADPKNTDALFLSAGLDFTDRQLDNARETLKALLKLDNSNIDAYVLAGQVEEAADNNRAAADHYQQAIARDSSNIFALNNLAYILSGDPARVDEAMTFARKAKELAPESPQVLDTLGWLYYRKGHYEMAVRELEAALAKAEWPSIQFHLGLTYNRLGNTSKGGRLLAAALAKEPELADTEALQ
jgi:tetratricopeptide (TPR) repeat protein